MDPPGPTHVWQSRTEQPVPAISSRPASSHGTSGWWVHPPRVGLPHHARTTKRRRPLVQRPRCGPEPFRPSSRTDYLRGFRQATSGHKGVCKSGSRRALLASDDDLRRLVAKVGRRSDERGQGVLHIRLARRLILGGVFCRTDRRPRHEYPLQLPKRGPLPPEFRADAQQLSFLYSRQSPPGRGADLIAATDCWTKGSSQP
jgi:hypothetical protein